MSLTEDGRFLVVTHQAANSITVWDAESQKLVKTLETPEPRTLLCRGDGFYVANWGQGTISCFSASKNWELMNQFDVDKPNIVHLPAAQGKAFDGRLLATCHPPGAQGSYQSGRSFSFSILHYSVIPEARHEEVQDDVMALHALASGT